MMADDVSMTVDIAKKDPKEPGIDNHVQVLCSFLAAEPWATRAKSHLQMLDGGIGDRPHALMLGCLRLESLGLSDRSRQDPYLFAQPVFLNPPIRFHYRGSGVLPS